MKRSNAILQSCFVIFLSFILLISCKAKEQKVTKEEALQTAEKIQSSITAERADFVNDLIDKKSLAKKIAAKMDADKKEPVSEIMNNLSETRMGDKIVDAVGNKGTYQLVKSYEKDEKQHLLFRMYADGRLNYHDFELIKLNNEIKASDLYIYITGDWISTTFSQTLSTAGMNDMTSSDADNMLSIRKKMGEGKYQEAKDALDLVPAVLKKEKAFQVMNVQICSGLSEDVYHTAMENYNRLYPNEPNMYLMMIDYYITKKEYQKSMDAVNKLDALIDKDPFLDYSRALIYNLMDDNAKAREKLEQLQINMPKFTEGTEELIANYAEAKEYEKASVLIKKYKSNQKINQAFLNALYLVHPDLATKFQ
ncbi:MAG: hypothetical protein ABJA78_05465 [Ferruginibacter sp.]